MSALVDRRSMLMAAPALALAASSSALAAASTPTDCGLARCIADYRRADAASRRFYREVYRPVMAAIDAVPHYTTQAGFKSLATGDRLIHMTTASEVDYRVARDFVERGSKHVDDFTECCRELAKAIDRRESQVSAIAERMRLDELAERSNELSERAAALLQVVEDFPTTTLNDLIVKLTFVAGELGDELSAESVLADLHRIVGRQ